MLALVGMIKIFFAPPGGKFCLRACWEWTLGRVLMAQRLALCAEDREVSGSSPTQD